MKLCIGLFGTCGDSTWRNDVFIPRYKSVGMVDGVDFYNPQLPGNMWDEMVAKGLEPAKIEAEHLAEDAVICFPITSQTYAAGSLAEVGFSILNAIQLNDRRDFVILIDRRLDQNLIDENPVAAKESMRARECVFQHLKRLRLSNLFMVETLEDMLETSLILFESARVINPLRQKFNIPVQFP